eukprot:486973-Prymnesium_polylepis.1
MAFASQWHRIRHSDADLRPTVAAAARSGGSGSTHDQLHRADGGQEERGHTPEDERPVPRPFAQSLSAGHVRDAQHATAAAIDANYRVLVSFHRHIVQKDDNVPGAEAGVGCEVSGMDALDDDRAEVVVVVSERDTDVAFARVERG